MRPMERLAVRALRRPAPGGEANHEADRYSNCQPDAHIPGHDSGNRTQRGSQGDS